MGVVGGQALRAPPCFSDRATHPPGSRCAACSAGPTQHAHLTATTRAEQMNHSCRGARCRGRESTSDEDRKRTSRWGRRGSRRLVDRWRMKMYCGDGSVEGRDWMRRCRGGRWEQCWAARQGGPKQGSGGRGGHGMQGGRWRGTAEWQGVVPQTAHPHCQQQPHEQAAGRQGMRHSTQVCLASTASGMHSALSPASKHRPPCVHTTVRLPLGRPPDEPAQQVVP